MIKFFKYFLFPPAFAIFFTACQTAPPAPTANVPTAPAPTIQKPTPPNNSAVVDVPKLALKSTAEVDKILGKPQTKKPIKDPLAGEYRVYRIANNPKGLAIRFYGDKATSFNLILEKSVPTSKQALREIFGIETGEAPPQIDKKEPLSEVWRGEFSGVKFVKTYAKRERENGGFIFVLAEVAP